MQGMILLELPPNVDPDVVRPGWGALLIVIGMLLLVGLLAWSMVRHMRRIRVPYADEVNGAEDGVQGWAHEMRANSPDQDEDEDVDDPTSHRTSTSP